ncbi:MerR family transcriptional regulator [Enterococcus sp. BWR-S5]|uniref:MerR family transcriptional regulator n=1 Tax=Enterococcus sp. BWR-S5 TaxID=2787714 RepID=UPI002ED6C90B
MFTIKTYKTAEVAKLVGLHPNTIRRYEEWGLIPTPKRAENGYRIFTDYHIDTIRIARVAFQIEVLQAGLRRQMVLVIKALAAYAFKDAQEALDRYIVLADREMKRAAEAITIVEETLAKKEETAHIELTRTETANKLKITTDALRNWELNGLLTVKRMKNGYRVYTEADLQRLKIIRTLRTANYSLEAILRLLHALDAPKKPNIKNVLDTPDSSEDIVSVCDKLLSSLEQAKTNARKIKKEIDQLERKYSKSL